MTLNDDELLRRIQNDLESGIWNLESRRRREDYTKAKEAMLEHTHVAEEPWWVVPADDKK